jgi:hypothetical protein
MTKTRTWENSHKQVWIDKEYVEKIEALRFRDESTNSVICFLYDFYKNAQPQIEEIMKSGDS